MGNDCTYISGRLNLFLYFRDIGLSRGGRFKMKCIE